MSFKHISMVCALSIVAGSACATDTTTERQPPEELAKYTATGETENCLSLSSIKDTDPLDDYNILFHTRGGDTYLSQLTSRCSGLGFEEAFSYATSLTRLCNTDIIRVIDTGGSGVNVRGSCGLGMFEKLEENPKEETG